MSNQNNTLSREFIERQRERLEALREQILGGEERTFVNERTFQAEHGDEATEFEDKAQDMAQNEVRQTLHDVDEHRMSNIERALQKIEEGSYGLSDMSGKPISKARLEATPEAVLTLDEKRNREKGG